MYAIDPAFKYAMSIGEDTGRVFENAVFLELRRRGIQPGYLLGDQEVDFFWADGLLINVCYAASEAGTRRREILGLTNAMHNMGLKESWLITAGEKSDISVDGNTIHVLPFGEFLNQY